MDFILAKKNRSMQRKEERQLQAVTLFFNISKCSYFCIQSKCNWIVCKRFAAECIWSRKTRTNLATKKDTY